MITLLRRLSIIGEVLKAKVITLLRVLDID